MFVYSSIDSSMIAPPHVVFLQMVGVAMTVRDIWCSCFLKLNFVQSSHDNDYVFPSSHHISSKM